MKPPTGWISGTALVVGLLIAPSATGGDFTVGGSGIGSFQDSQPLSKSGTGAAGFGGSFRTTARAGASVGVASSVAIPRPEFVDLTAFSRSNAVGFYYAGAKANVSAVNSFGPPLGVPVFALPDGFTANSASMGLVDNVIAVPEPSPSALVGAGLLALGVVRARRRRG